VIFESPTYTANTCLHGISQPTDILYSSEDIYNIARELDSFNTVAIIDLQLTEADRLALEQFEITSVKGKDDEELYAFPFSQFYATRDYDMAVEQQLANSTYGFLKSISPQSSTELLNHLTTLLERIVYNATLSLPHSGAAVAIITASLSKIANRGVDLHHDDFVNDRFSKATQSFRLLATLKGEHTLFLTGSPEYEPGQCLISNNDLKTTEGKLNNINTIFYDMDPKPLTSVGFASIHKMSTDCGALHSGPPEVRKSRLLLRLDYYDVA